MFTKGQPLLNKATTGEVMATKEIDVVSENIGQGKPVGLSEISASGGIDVVADRVTSEDLKLEKFMNDILTIIVHHSAKDGDLDIVTPSVGGINQPIIRGVESKIRRKYVEALARARSTSFTQRQMDYSDPSTLKMIPNSRVSYPFSVIHDPNPKGRTWLEGIMREE